MLLTPRYDLFGVLVRASYFGRVCYYGRLSLFTSLFELMALCGVVTSALRRVLLLSSKPLLIGCSPICRLFPIDGTELGFWLEFTPLSRFGRVAREGVVGVVGRVVGEGEGELLPFTVPVLDLLLLVALLLLLLGALLSALAPLPLLLSLAELPPSPSLLSLSLLLGSG